MSYQQNNFGLKFSDLADCPSVLTPNDLLVVNSTGQGVTQTTASSIVPGFIVSGTPTAGDIAVFTGSTPILSDSGCSISTGSNIVSIYSGASNAMELQGATNAYIQAGVGTLYIYCNGGSARWLWPTANASQVGQVLTDGGNLQNMVWMNPSGLLIPVSFASSSSFTAAVHPQQYLNMGGFTSSQTAVLNLPVITSGMAGNVIKLTTSDDTFKSLATSLTITPNSGASNKINGASTLVLTATGQAHYGFTATASTIEIYCDGSQWLCSVAST